jgi:hemolysin III
MTQACEITSSAQTPDFAIRSESANQATHAAGLCLSLIGGGVLMAAALQSSDPYRIAGCAVYALTLTALYAASTLSHSFSDTDRRRFYRMLDQVCIFLLVVGTYTPFGLVHARDGGWIAVLIGMWLYAFVGIGLRVRRPDETLRPLFFLLMGWIPAPILFRAYEVSHIGGLSMILAGGLAYSGGVWFLLNDHKHPYFHAVWHVCTIVGSAMHFLFVLKYVAPLAA